MGQYDDLDYNDQNQKRGRSLMGVVKWLVFIAILILIYLVWSSIFSNLDNTEQVPDATLTPMPVSVTATPILDPTSVPIVETAPVTDTAVPTVQPIVEPTAEVVMYIDLAEGILEVNGDDDLTVVVNPTVPQYVNGVEITSYTISNWNNVIDPAWDGSYVEVRGITHQGIAIACWVRKSNGKVDKAPIEVFTSKCVIPNQGERPSPQYPQ